MSSRRVDTAMPGLSTPRIVTRSQTASGIAALTPQIGAPAAAPTTAPAAAPTPPTASPTPPTASLTPPNSNPAAAPTAASSSTSTITPPSNASTNPPEQWTLKLRFSLLARVDGDAINRVYILILLRRLAPGVRLSSFTILHRQRAYGTPGPRHLVRQDYPDGPLRMTRLGPHFYTQITSSRHPYRSLTRNKELFVPLEPSDSQDTVRGVWLAAQRYCTEFTIRTQNMSEREIAVLVNMLHSIVVTGVRSIEVDVQPPLSGPFSAQVEEDDGSDSHMEWR